MKAQGSAKLVEVFESLSDITVTLLGDFLADPNSGGLAVALRLADTGATVFPVGVVGEDEPGRAVLHALQQHKISTSGVSRIQHYLTPNAATGELLHGEHPALLNLIEHARKFASASDAMYVCDHGIGAASPRALNFVKSNGCMREKTLVARSLHRLVDFEQLTAAVTTGTELEQAIGIFISDDEDKLAVAAQGMMQELQTHAVLASTATCSLLVAQGHRPASLSAPLPQLTGLMDLLGAFFAAALSTDADPIDAAELALRLTLFFSSHPSGKRPQRDDLLRALSPSSTAKRAR